MEIKEIVLPSINKFASDYVKGLPQVNDFFHYDVKEVKVYEKRYHDLMERYFNRNELKQTIEAYMNKFGIREEVRNNLDLLAQDDSVVVIGGQQAGLLTGPLYTIHKVISIIKLAEEQSRLLNKPVIPVFWIAGEDHDIDEVNHVYVEQDNSFKKKSFYADHPTKLMISDIAYDHELMEKWLKEVFVSFEETEYTKELFGQVLQFSKQSANYTEFFAFIINELYGRYGLLLIDSADAGFRSMQSSFFEQLILQNREVNAAVSQQQSRIRECGYKNAIAMDENNANLFYYDKKDRVLLEYNSDSNMFNGKNSDIELTAEELLAVAKHSPEKLSNNVVTRPLMQEKMFPVLAFISGPGEIAYWAELQKAFELFEMKMPLIVPRMNLTILEQKIKKDLWDTDMDLYEALVHGAGKAKERYLDSVEDDTLRMLHQRLKSQFERNHELLSQAALMSDKGLSPILKKNAEVISTQIDFIANKIKQSTESRNQLVLNKYTRIDHALRPNGGPQERTTNVYYFLNQYGAGWIDDLMSLPLEANSFHKVIEM
ncbi:bacillithiol biosynthesis cysteine-adding enzyme BshC [Bacillus sp. AGMB 02131]|uniref:Putative cysteine ligase BshC n=1 Tax=Peribacillus faecalis TaxID=2772559 RepID=A0A927CS12_9BACI|nr:bacillithiol biosynthesis cysteine-adding enzyme BshC [Peribacillus faecalis]MBD3106832.1 bacillithiol biosynthesis cysteine-adding enzyme BshC [Peribacillus faecalis]